VSYPEELKALFDKYIIDRTKPEYADFPHTLEGELLLEKAYYRGRFAGWITVHPDDFLGLFSSAVEEHRSTGRPLFDCLMEEDDVKAEVDLDLPTEEEAERVAKLLDLDVELCKRVIEEAKASGLTGVQTLKFGERGYKGYFKKWYEEGLI